MSLFPDILRLPSLSTVPLLALLALTDAVPVCAQELTLVPSLSLRQEYNDNVDATVSNRRSDHITTVSPALSASLGTETAKGSVAGGVNALYYLQETKSNSVGYFVKGDGNYSATPRLSLATDLGFIRDSRASSIDPVTALSISSRTSHLTCRAGGTYQLSEAASALVELNYGRDDYDSPLYLDSSYYQGSAGLSYDLERYLPAATLAQLLSFRQDRTSVSQVDDINATIGFSKKLDELWALSASGGVRFTRSEFSAAPGGERATNDDVGAVGKFSLSYSGESTSASLALSHALTSASGRTGTTQLTGGTCSVYEKFTSTLSGSVSAGYAWNRSAEKQFAAQAVDERSRNVSGSLFYRILEAPRNLALEARYSYHTTQYRHTTEMNQNVVMLQLNWQHDLLR